MATEMLGTLTQNHMFVIDVEGDSATELATTAMFELVPLYILKGTFRCKNWML